VRSYQELCIVGNPAYSRSARRTPYVYALRRLAERPLLPHGGHACSGGSWPSVVLDAEEVLLSQQLI
jgi:hypothetical protein